MGWLSKKKKIETPTILNFYLIRITKISGTFAISSNISKSPLPRFLIVLICMRISAGVTRILFVGEQI